MAIITYIPPLINLFISGTIMYYLYYLEKMDCKCSLTFQRNYIYYYTLIIFIINALTIFFQETLRQFGYKVSVAEK